MGKAMLWVSLGADLKTGRVPVQNRFDAGAGRKTCRAQRMERASETARKSRQEKKH